MSVYSKPKPVKKIIWWHDGRIPKDGYHAQVVHTDRYAEIEVFGSFKKLNEYAKKIGYSVEKAK